MLLSQRRELQSSRARTCRRTKCCQVKLDMSSFNARALMTHPALLIKSTFADHLS